MNTVHSKDGTTIAYDKKGAGPAVILVDPALSYRAFDVLAPLANLLYPHFTVYTYDRRGRGQSSNSKPYSIDREVEDIEAVIDAAGGSAYLFGISSGACLALHAAAKLYSKVRKLAMYEPPFNSDPDSIKPWKDYWTNLNKAISEGRRGDAVTLFMRFAGTSEDQINEMHKLPLWSTFEAVAPTLAYDAAAIGEDHTVPVKLAAEVKAQTLVMDGGANAVYMPFMRATAHALAESIPHAQERTLEGQTHNVNYEILAPILIDFYKS